jgi:hypothetical protein
VDDRVQSPSSESNSCQVVIDRSNFDELDRLDGSICRYVDEACDVAEAKKLPDKP